MPRRTIAISDIHGCVTALRTLLETLAPASDDLIVPLGDYVDRGPDSRAVIEELLRLESCCKLRPLLGNHEEMMLMVLSGQTGPASWLRYGGVDTLDSYGFTGDLSVVPESHREFLRRCLDYVETDEHFFVHANYRADVPLSELDPEVLRWESLEIEMPGPHISGKTAVVGHTADQSGEILDVGYLKCIDTYCYGGQWLTALDVNSGQIWQANDAGQMRDP